VNVPIGIVFDKVCADDGGLYGLDHVQQLPGGETAGFMMGNTWSERRIEYVEIH